MGDGAQKVGATETVRPVEAQESILISIKPLVLGIVEEVMRKDSWIMSAGPIIGADSEVSLSFS